MDSLRPSMDTRPSAILFYLSLNDDHDTVTAYHEAIDPTAYLQPERWR